MSTLENAAAVLTLFVQPGTDALPESLSFSDMARRLPLPKSTLSRLFIAMESQGLLARDPHNRHYRVGHLLRSLSPPAPQSGPATLAERAAQALHQLSARYRCTGYLCMLHRDKVRIVDRFQSCAAAPAIYAVGSHLPAMNTAVGRALLACFSEREVIARLMPRQGRLGDLISPALSACGSDCHWCAGRAGTSIAMKPARVTARSQRRWRTASGVSRSAYVCLS